ncbi:bacteriophage protein [Escherichia coli]|uniref:Bacteriophage protein n=1 Tax=Escherichia coli TaxID=562 RepID=A0AAX2K367_ECOLX|nr:bacteriophage protein [Escherichia coli]
MARSVLDYGPAERQREPVISGIPLVTGADLLAQYACMGLGLSWWWSVMTTHRITPQKLTWAVAAILLVSTE